MSRLISALWFLALVLVAVLLVLIYCHPPVLTASVIAESEWLEFEVTGIKGVDWNVSDFELLACTGQGQSVKPTTLGEGAEILIGPGVRVQLAKLQGSPLVQIELSSPPSEATDHNEHCAVRSSVILMGADGVQRELYGSHLFLKYRATQQGSPWFSPARVLTLRGIVTTGHDTRPGSEEMLLGGNASLHAYQENEFGVRPLSSPGRGLTYVVGSIPLERGDVVSPSASGTERREARGYVRIPAQEVLQVGYYVGVDRLVIHRAGNAIVEIDQSIWSRLQNEPALGKGAAFLALLIAAGETVPKLARIWRFVFRQQPVDEGAL